MEQRNSLTHPLRIADVDIGDGLGRLGVTFCPGKKQALAMTGRWHRDLCVDLDAVEAWGGAAVLSLIEDHEITSLGVSALGAELGRRQMDWLHLPIGDFSVPGQSFEGNWSAEGEGVRARLRDGFSIVVHCKGGLGRAGMVTAKILTELGHHSPRAAISAVRQARPGAIETPGQASYVLSQTPVPEVQPSTSRVDIEDRALGALLGLAVGDAVGTTLEFRARDTYAYLSDMVGGGPFGLSAGQWTDDTSMALALADSLLANPELDTTDLMDRFVSWHDHGEYSCGCKDIGLTVSRALSKYRRDGNSLAGSTDPMSAGNGSLMRLAPVAMACWRDRAQLANVAERQSRTTHSAPEAIDACLAFANVLSDAIAGLPRSKVMASRPNSYAGRIAEITSGSWRGKRRQDIRATGYVAHTLEAAMWCVGRTADFRSAVLLAANLGEDADTTAAVTGQLAGAVYGMSKIPAEWLDRLVWKRRISDVGRALIAPTLA